MWIYRSIDKVDATVAEIQEHMQVANEVSEAISTANYGGPEIDEVRHFLPPFINISDFFISQNNPSLWMPYQLFGLSCIGGTEERVGGIGAGRAERQIGRCGSCTGASSSRSQSSSRQYVFLFSSTIPSSNLTSSHLISTLSLSLIPLPILPAQPDRESKKRTKRHSSKSYKPLSRCDLEIPCVSSSSSSSSSSFLSFFWCLPIRFSVGTSVSISLSVSPLLSSIHPFPPLSTTSIPFLLLLLLSVVSFPFSPFFVCVFSLCLTPFLQVIEISVPNSFFVSSIIECNTYLFSLSL